MAGVIRGLLFPRKCVLCGRLLRRREEFLCPDCRTENSPRDRGKTKLAFIARWYALWNYQDAVRDSIRRFKFADRQNYAAAYAHFLGAELSSQGAGELELLTWVPIGPKRMRRRGYDQARLLGECLGKELGLESAALLKKRVDNRPQSGISGTAQRRANVLGVYQAVNVAELRGRRILLVDDVLTSGATASECARVLLTAGAKEVWLTTVAAVPRMK